MTNSRSLRVFTSFITVMLVFIVAFAVIDCDQAHAAAKTRLKSVSYYEISGDSASAELTWYSKKGKSYSVYRKVPGGSWSKIATVKGKKSTTSYVDKKIGYGKSYTYTVRLGKGGYDTTGLTLLADTNSRITKQGNMSTTISWDKVAGATSYRIYRKADKSRTSYKLVATVSGTNLSYTDNYWKTVNKNSSADAGILFVDNSFIDPSSNNLVYTVRAQRTTKVAKKKYKYSYGMYSKEGDWTLEAPSIVSLDENGDNATLTWGTVPNADGYYVYTSSEKNGFDFDNPVADVAAPGRFAYNKNVTVNTTVDKAKYYSVRAYTKKNGEIVLSKHNLGNGYDVITGKDRKYNEDILWLGDSITYGSPYYRSRDTSTNISPEWHKFSIPNRVNQLTGNVSTASLVNETEGYKTHFYNPSIPGSTYYTPIYSISGKTAFTLKPSYENSEPKKLPYNNDKLYEGKWQDGDKTSFNRARIVDEVVAPIVNKETPQRHVILGTTDNTTSLEDYDIIVLSAGTNDFTDCAPLANKVRSYWTALADNFTTYTTKDGETASWCNDVKLNVTNRSSSDYNPSFDKTTFYGAYNTIMKRIEDASRARVEEGKDPIKVVAVDLFYSDRIYYTKITDKSSPNKGKTYYPRMNRFDSKNKNDVSKVNGFGQGGNNLSDYQACLDTLNKIWNDNSSYIKIYTYHTNNTGIVTSSNCPQNASDNLHFTKYVYNKFGDSIAEFLMDNVFNDSFTAPKASNILDNLAEIIEESLDEETTPSDEVNTEESTSEEATTETTIEEKTEPETEAPTEASPETPVE